MICLTCQKLFTRHRGRVGNLTGQQQRFCSISCRKQIAPAVYCFIAGDGRLYIGSTSNIRTRTRLEVKRSNPRLLEGFLLFAPNTWHFKILEKLKPGCTLLELKLAEQKHIDRLRSSDPRYGFNMQRATR